MHTTELMETLLDAMDGPSAIATLCRASRVDPAARQKAFDDVRADVLGLIESCPPHAAILEKLDASSPEHAVKYEALIANVATAYLNYLNPANTKEPAGELRNKTVAAMEQLYKTLTSADYRIHATDTQELLHQVIAAAYDDVVKALPAQERVHSL